MKSKVSSLKLSGYSESNVALATFPVQHFVNHRCLRVNRVRGKRGEDGYITAHVGDAQASPVSLNTESLNKIFSMHTYFL